MPQVFGAGAAGAGAAGAGAAGAGAAGAGAGAALAAETAGAASAALPAGAALAAETAGAASMPLGGTFSGHAPTLAADVPKQGFLSQFGNFFSDLDSKVEDFRDSPTGKAIGATSALAGNAFGGSSDDPAAPAMIAQLAPQQMVSPQARIDDLLVRLFQGML